MIKDFEEEKTVTVTTKRVVCDLCGEKVPGNVYITVNVNVQTDHNLASYPGSNRHTTVSIDVCSTQCLADNIGAIRLQFDTKAIPAAQEAAEKMKDKGLKESIADYGFTSSYAMGTVTTSAAPTSGYYNVKL